jgi:RNA polymerase sigma-70 factor (ECF subfamily)
MDISSSPSPVADVAALGQLLQEYRPRLLAMLQRRLDPQLNPRLDAEEILSMAFLQARRRWTAFQARPAMKPYPWLYRIALDCLIEAWRRETRSPRDVRRAMPLPDATSLQLGLGLVHPGTSPSAALARDEVRAQVRLVMSQLKDGEREILLMRHFDDLSYADISAVLGVTENTAMKRYGRALDKLSDRWMEMFPDHE